MCGGGDAWRLDRPPAGRWEHTHTDAPSTTHTRIHRCPRGVYKHRVNRPSYSNGMCRASRTRKRSCLLREWTASIIPARKQIAGTISQVEELSALATCAGISAITSVDQQIGQQVIGATLSDPGPSPISLRASYPNGRGRILIVLP